MGTTEAGPALDPMRSHTHVQGHTYAGLARQRQPSVGRTKTLVPSVKTRGSETAGRRPVSRTDTKLLETPFVTMSATDSWTLCVPRLHEAAQAMDPITRISFLATVPEAACWAPDKHIHRTAGRATRASRARSDTMAPGTGRDGSPVSAGHSLWLPLPGPW